MLLSTEIKPSKNSAKMIKSAPIIFLLLSLQKVILQGTFL